MKLVRHREQQQRRKLPKGLLGKLLKEQRQKVLLDQRPIEL